MSIIKKIYDTITAYDLIRAGETVLCGVSGGPDSVAMIHILKEINDLQKTGWKLHVAHLNHGLRGAEADEDEKFVRAMAKKLGLPCTTRKEDVARVKQEEKMSIEEAARAVRHEFLRQLALDLKATKIALAHTMDDQAETIMHRILRGTGLKGLKGMMPIRLLSRRADLYIVRPMIELERHEVMRFLEERQLAHRHDATNDDLTRTRNRMRHVLIPMIEKDFNPKVKMALVKLAQTAASSYILLREIANEVFENVKMLGKEDEVCLSVDEFMKTPPALQTLLIDRAMKILLGKVPQLHFEHYLEIISLCMDQGFSKVVTLPKGLQARRESYVLKICKVHELKKPPTFKGQKIKVPGKTLIRSLRIRVDAEIMEGKVVGMKDYIQNKDYSEEIVDLERLALPLTLRFRHDGDSFNPLGAHGSCKLKKFFIDHKVPKETRNQVPVLMDQDKIVWVVGYRISDDVKITDTSRKLLRLKVVRL